MSDDHDYSIWDLEQLQREEKEIKKKNTISAILTGFLIGIMVFGLANNGFGFIYVFIPLLFIYANTKNSQKLKKSLKEIRRVINTKNQSDPTQED